jgi:hypothetical protein
MNTRIFVALMCLAGPVGAETLVVDDQVVLKNSAVERPARGSTMGSVESKFGAPSQKHATVGQPPITRWDYPSFSVFFENDRVVHAVALGG